MVLIFLFCAGMVRASDVTVPFQLCCDRNAVLVTVEINSRSYDLLLDTGSEFTVLAPEVAGMSMVDLKKASFSSGPGMSGEAVWFRADLRLGSTRLDQRPVVVMNLERVSKVYGRKISGLVGQDILSQFSSVTLDFKNRRLVLAK